MKIDTKQLFSFDLKRAMRHLFNSVGGIAALYLFALLPFFFLLSSFIKRLDLFDALQGQVAILNKQMEQVKELHRDRTLFAKRYGQARSTFVEEVVSQLLFLKPEVKMLSAVCSHRAFESSQRAQQRLEALTTYNRLHFSLGEVEVMRGVEELSLSQEHPVTIDSNDLKEILEVVEGREPVGYRPQLIVEHFNLKKEKEVYQLQMDLIQRRLVD